MKSHSVIELLAITLVTISLVACGGGGGGGEPAASASGGSNQLVGTWEGVSFDGEALVEPITLTLTDTEYTWETDCTETGTYAATDSEITFTLASGDCGADSGLARTSKASQQARNSAYGITFLENVLEILGVKLGGKRGTLITTNITTKNSGSGSGIESLIIGTWLSDCSSAGGKSINHTYTFGDSGQGELYVNGYYDSVCGSLVPSYKIIYFSYSLGAEISMTGIVKRAYNLNITRNSWQVIANGVVIITGGGEPTEYGIVAVADDITLYAGFGVETPYTTDPGDRPTTFAAFYIRQ